MANIIFQFVVWFFTFFASIFIDSVLGWAEQGVAFLFLYIGMSLLIRIIGFFALLEFLNWPSVFRFWIYQSIGLGFVLFTTWGASQIFDVNFYVAYQLMTFGQCLCITQNSKKR